MKGYFIHLEEETVNNTDYRRVLYTAQGMQLVLMSLLPGEEIGAEVHELDQLIRVEGGVATAILGNDFMELADGDAVIIPKGLKHNVINRGQKPVKLYSLYAPPEHRDGLIQRSKADEKEEHFDGKTTE